MNNYSQMPIEALEPQYQVWAQVLARHQSGNLFFLKNTGMLTRILQFQDWHKTFIKTPLVMLDIDIDLVSSPREFELALKNLKSNAILVVRDHFTHPDSSILEMILQKHYLLSTHSLLVVHECAPHELIDSNNHTSSLHINQFLYSPPTTESNLHRYIENICQLWLIKLTQHQIENILSYCGNNAWLINEYIRMSVSNPTLSPEQLIQLPAIQYRVKTLYDTLPLTYQKYFSHSTHNLDIIQELTTYNLIDKLGHPIGHWLKDSIVSHQKLLLNITDTKVIYNQIDLSVHFSPGENRILALTTTGPLHTREKIAQAFYDTQEPEYSDWALSQIISRLRSKLKRLGIPVQITPKRGQGYEFSR